MKTPEILCPNCQRPLALGLETREANYKLSPLHEDLSLTLYCPTSVGSGCGFLSHVSNWSKELEAFVRRYVFPNVFTDFKP